MIFVRSASCGIRFDFYGEGQRYAAAILSAEFEAAWTHALSTAR